MCELFAKFFFKFLIGLRPFTNWAKKERLESFKTRFKARACISSSSRSLCETDNNGLEEQVLPVHSPLHLPPPPPPPAVTSQHRHLVINY